MSDLIPPGTCPFCSWDRPGDPPHSQNCVIGRHVEFARKSERAAIVADLRARAGAGELSAPTERTLRVLADLYERGEHEGST